MPVVSKWNNYIFDWLLFHYSFLTIFVLDAMQEHLFSLHLLITLKVYCVLYKCYEVAEYWKDSVIILFVKVCESFIHLTWLGRLTLFAVSSSHGIVSVFPTYACKYRFVSLISVFRLNIKQLFWLNNSRPSMSHLLSSQQLFRYFKSVVYCRSPQELNDKKRRF